MAYIVLAGIYLLLLNIITTIRLSKSELNEKSQKVYQTILIWLLPLIGAVVVLTLLNQDEPVEFMNKNIFKNFMLFVFFIKIKKMKIKSTMVMKKLNQLQMFITQAFRQEQVSFDEPTFRQRICSQ